LKGKSFFATFYKLAKKKEPAKEIIELKFDGNVIKPSKVKAFS
jgi:hypothetical protein